MAQTLLHSPLPSDPKRAVLIALGPSESRTTGIRGSHT
jgi:hypothetical protein